ncbi:MAG TPA: hypothetical protein VF533_21955 [Solirubrobacteraceae bacterium]|jgi:hypothetical protein
MDDPKHNPGEPEFGEHADDAPHNPGEPQFGDEPESTESTDDVETEEDE